MLYPRQVEYREQRHRGHTDTKCPDAGIPLPPVDIMVLARPNTVTEERSDTRDPTGNPTYGILRPTSSSEVYRVGRYYVGVLKELPPPDIIYDEWNEHICGDLINHLLAVTDSLPNDIPDDHLIIEPVLCMAGKTKSMRLTTHERHARGKVMLEPMVWIHCGSRKCRRKVKETIHQARFLQNFLQRFGMAEAHIALEAPWPAAHIASTADQQYSSASEEQKVSVDDQDRRLYDSGYDSASLMSYTPSISSLMYSEMSSRSMWQPSSTASTSPSQPGNRIPFISQHYYSSPPSIHGQLSQWPLTVNHEAPAFPGARTRNLPYSRRGSNVDHPPMSLSASEYAENGSSDSYIRPRQTICDVDDRQLALSFAIQLRYDIHSACGIGTRFCLHDSGSSFSTIGGLIVVDNSVFGLTTAHGIIACLDASKTPSSSDTDEDTSESGSDSDPSFPVGISKPRNRRRDYSRGSEVATQGTAQHEWSPVLVPSIVSYKGRGTLTGDYGLPTQSPPMSDFALVELDCNLLGTLKNSYRDPSTSIIKDISGSLDNNQLSAGEVLIITSSNVIPGYLLDGTASVILRGTAMRTKKIQIQISHGEGISGAWVVRDHLVCGCIFAAYNTGRYLHMLPIEDTLRSIFQFTNSTSVRIATTNDLAGPPSPASKHPAGLPGDMPDVTRCHLIRDDSSGREE
ncbi:predicted protein [Aspergillus terreus NIH2624]|uniref:Uncharacterized protein n=1 Tax=Aspergillus terreus (strain NIH 2624 / FGSC A1156) TaxID=341663 RepID=Q0CMW3_ASPTN|nr:uncharacterized protein ATEG_04971 [Aspergillus terreus NIH2624]EAU34040.1 predicted protein [Aspergillus terreus NIH2624]